MLIKKLAKLLFDRHLCQVMQVTPDIDYKRLYEGSQLRILALEQQLSQLQKMIFGSRQERFVPVEHNPSQLSLDIQAEATASSSVVNTKRISYTRTQTTVEQTPLVHPGRMKLPEDLRREEIVIEPDGDISQWKKIGAEITEVLEATCKLIEPLYEALKKEVLTGSYLHVDETPIKVLDKDKKGQTHRGFYWVYQNSLEKIFFSITNQAGEEKVL